MRCCTKICRPPGAARVADTNAWDMYVHNNPPGILLWDLPQVTGIAKDIVWTPTQSIAFFKLTDLSWKK